MSFIFMLFGVGAILMTTLTYILKYVAKTYKLGPFLEDMPSTDDSVLEVKITPPEAPKLPVQPVSVPVPTPQYSFATAKEAWHSVRVLCDNAGLTLNQKNLICACIYQESRFLNTAKHVNPTSTDWGIAQINDHYHIGPNKDFPTVEYVLDNPDKVIEWMIEMYKEGLLSQWVSYSSGAYSIWLKPDSPMWTLAS